MERKTAWEQASEWFGRTLAIVIVMVLPGALGSWLDQRLGTTVLTLLGFGFGMILAISMLILFTKIKKVDDRVAPDSSASANRTAKGPGNQNESVANDRSAQRPSESPLPKVPGADIYEAPRQDD